MSDHHHHHEMPNNNDNPILIDNTQTSSSTAPILTTSQSISSSSTSSSLSCDIPFLVTHYLMEYSKQLKSSSFSSTSATTTLNNTCHDNNTTRSSSENIQTTNHHHAEHHDSCLERIQKATSELASAFADLGAFGTTLSSPLGNLNNSSNNASSSMQQSLLRPATYSDIRRKWDTTLSPNALESILQSSISTTQAAYQFMTFSQTCSHPTSSFIDAAYEAQGLTNIVNSKPGGGGGGGGSNDNHHDTADSLSSSHFISNSSILQKPTLVESIHHSTTNESTQQLLTKFTQQYKNLTALSSSTSNSTIPLVQQLATLGISSNHERVKLLAAQASRRYLTLRSKFRDEESMIRELQRSIRFQQDCYNQSQKKMDALTCRAVASIHTSATFDASTMTATTPLDQLESNKQQALRVMCTLERKIQDLNKVHTTQTKHELLLSQNVHQLLVQNAHTILSEYSDPSCESSTSYTRLPFQYSKVIGMSNKQSSVLSHVLTREYCAGSFGRRMNSGCGVVSKRVMNGLVPTSSLLCERRKVMLKDRVSHSITINCHLSYPIYCICFDRTGRYFVTGADDHLVKLFVLGCPPSSMVRKGLRRRVGFGGGSNIGATGGNSHNDYNQIINGAVLVRTFRGHDGVITDVDISHDNTLLATASEDGDVRIWSLIDGCPVAILRGHKGGANMVSWSQMNPFRLVTTADDGLARIWDIREAALHRCTEVVSRVDYTLNKKPKDSTTDVRNQLNTTNTTLDATAAHREVELNDDLMLPPLPPPNATDRSANINVPAINIETINNRNAVNDVQANNSNNNNNNPIGFHPRQRNISNEENEGDNRAPGAFVANDEIDEGVKLLAKMQHGEPIDDLVQGPSTRSRKAVKVICVARCPIGGLFATGSDDGLGRLWLDEDDERIDDLDRSLRGKKSICSVPSMTCLLPYQVKDSLNRTRSSIRDDRQNDNIVPSTAGFLANLHGHLNPITDIQFSYKGDRLLTASQKDGVVRIWSWRGVIIKSHDVSHSEVSIDSLKHIVIHLTAPDDVGTRQTSQSFSRRRTTGITAPSVHCDVAKWTIDDSKIITSQSFASQGNKAKNPAANRIYIWDSLSGQCLVGLTSTHTLPCPVILTHPYDPSIFVSAGGDGFAKVWDMDEGKCIFSHHNIILHGPVEPTVRGKPSGYLDANFSPDGSRLILTDDCGRITILESRSREFRAIDGDNLPESTHSAVTDVTVCPNWMKEQYFASDYYDLFYDENGYCIDRGSLRPPHLAPEAARCSCTGTSYHDQVQRAFSKLQGPSPLSEIDVRLARDNVRVQSFHIRKPHGIMSINVTSKQRHCQPLLPWHDESEKIDSRPESNTRIYLTQDSSNASNQSPQHSSTEPARRIRTLSSNYRWREFNEDEASADEGGMESDDEEYVQERQIRRPREDNSDDNLSQVDDDDDDDDESSVGNTRSRARTARTARRERRDQSRSQRSVLEGIELNQPTRISARQSRQKVSRRAQNSDDDSDGSIIEEMLSCNTHPFGEYATDYTERGHFFKFPKAIHRGWVSRIEYQSSKIYSPQVGDVVVYIPRAHYDTLQAYPRLSNSASSAPWKSWHGTPWPVVRCVVKNIRYRFPFSDDHKNFKSLLAIVTLEITGIPPPPSSDECPWPKPEFLERPSTRSGAATFDITLFENDQIDFLIPEYLYTWRVSKLEQAVLDGNKESFQMYSFFVKNQETGDDGDPDYEPFCCTCIGIKNHDTETEYHFANSGYGAIMAKYDGDGFVEGEDLLSTWEVDVLGSSSDVPLPTCLTTVQEKAVIDILDTVSKNEEYVYFTFPVNTDMYVDYLKMIELPMDLSLIRERTQRKYYTNIQSVLADVLLIRINCVKYNDKDSDIVKSACNLYDEFQSLLENKLREIDSAPGERYRTRRSTRFPHMNPISNAEGRNANVANTNGSSSGREVTNRSSSRVSASSRANVISNVTSVSRFREGIDDESESSGEDEPTPSLAEITPRSIRAANRSAGESSKSRITRASHQQLDEDMTLEDDETATRKQIRPNTDIENHSDFDDDSHHEEQMPSKKMKYDIQERKRQIEDDTENDSRRQRQKTSPYFSAQASSVIKKTVTKTSNLDVENCERVSIRLRGTRTSYEEFPDIDFDNDSESVQQKSSSKRQTRRAVATKECYEESDDDSESDNQKLIRKRHTRRASATKRSYDDSDDDSESDHQKLSSKKQTRRTATTKNSYDDSDDDSESDNQKFSSRRQTRRAATTKRSYGDSEEDSYGDEYLEDNLSDDMSDDTDISSVKKPNRKTSTSQRKSKQKKKSQPKSKSSSAIKPPMPFPAIPMWPAQTTRSCSVEELAESILEKVEAQDAEYIFFTPVIEQIPDMADSYLRIISEPMDFRTIRSKLSSYEVIQDLQDDLILIFKNCCVFNGDKSEYYNYAIEIWSSLTDIFKATLTEKGIEIPRRM